MNLKKSICASVVMGTIAFGAGLAQAETVELVTYFPTGGGGGQDPQLRSLRVGNAYAGSLAPGDGVALIFNALGIGIPAGVGDPSLRFQVEENQNATSASGVSNPNIGNNAVTDFRVGQDIVTNNGQYGALNYYGSGVPAGFQGYGNPNQVSLVAALGAINGLTIATNANAPIKFLTNSDGVNNERMRITGNGNVGIGTNNPQSLLQVGAASLFVQGDQGGNLEIGGSNAIANPVLNGMPYVDFHFGRLAGVAQDFNARLINAADGRLDVQTSVGGAAAQTRFSVGANVGVGTTTPQTTSPQNNVAAGNLDANDVFIRSRGLWVTQMLGGRLVAVNTVANFANFVNFNATETVIGNITVTATGRPLLIVVSHIVCSNSTPQKGFQSRIRLDGTGINGAIVMQHGGGVQPFICEGGTVVCVHTPAAGQHTYYFTLRNGTNNNVLRGQATQISVTELG